MISAVTLLAMKHSWWARTMQRAHPLASPRRHHQARPQRDLGDPDRLVVIWHERLGGILAADDVDAVARGQGPEAQQLAGAGGGQQQLLGIGKLWAPAKGPGRRSWVRATLPGAVVTRWVRSYAA